MAGTADDEKRHWDEINRGLRRPQRRVRIRIDMTPMVDIAFLLLIFYMVTTVFARPTRMEISLPPKSDTYEPEPIAESKLLRLFVDKCDSFYYQIEEHMEYPVKVDFKELAEIINSKSRSVEGLVMLLKLDQEASYASMVQLIDKIQGVERAINNEIGIARRCDPELITEDYSPRLILRNMSAYDEYLLDLANMERRKKP
jgi:biopolymer transport protein ExbD